MSYDRELSSGDRRDKIEIISNGIRSDSGDIKNILNGIENKSEYDWCPLTGAYFIFNFKKAIYLKNIKFLTHTNSYNFDIGYWDIYVSNDNVDYTLVKSNELVGYKNTENSIMAECKYLKLAYVGSNNGNSDPYIDEVLFDYEDVCFLIKQNENLFSINSNTYDTNSKSYTNIPCIDGDKKGMYVNNTFELNNMYNEVTINGETFKPADKFNSFRISKFRN